MATSAFKGGLTVKRVNTGVSPNVATAIPEVKSMGGLGKSNELIDVTNFDSNNVREYIAGLADGKEFTVQCNRTHASPSQQDVLIADVDAGSTITLKVELTDGTTQKNYQFSAVALEWDIVPAINDANIIDFRFKISGDITVS